MNDRAQNAPKLPDLPRPRVTRMRWPYPLIWLVPLAALAAAGYYLHLHVQERGMQISVEFKDGSGLKVGETPVTIHGVQVGKVTHLWLSDDHQKVHVQIALQRQYASIASSGALFWVVRPDFSDWNFSGLGTVVSGAYIEAVPGVGAAKSEFVGLEKPPVSLGDGLILILHAPRLEHLQPDSPIYYRGVQVGVLQSAHLANDATHVNINVVIWQRFSRLVTKKSEFWRLSGADVKGGIFSGISVKLDSLRTLISGGIEFATPEEDATLPAQDGADFTLHDEPKKDWLTWAPNIPLPSEAASRPDAAGDKGEPNSLESAIKKKP